MHIAHEGNTLDCGDIIRLSRFPPLTITSSGRDNPQQSLAIVIHTYSKIGYSSIPPKLKPPARCIDVSMSAQIEAVLTDTDVGDVYFEDDKGDANSKWKPLVKVTCTPENRHCANYGVSTVLCVCKSDPVDQIDLEVVKQYCFFATTEVSKMSNSNKRNMLYWWYMTNTYNIFGKGSCEEPPTCLKAAIRKAYSSERSNGQYKKYNPGSKFASKHKTKK